MQNNICNCFKPEINSDLKKLPSYKLFPVSTVRTMSIKTRGKLSWPWGALLCFFLLLGSSCQQRSDVTDQAVQVQSEESTTAVGSESEPAISASDSEVVNGIHMPTGLVAEEGYLLVQNNCISCHSLDLVINKRATREGWLSSIRWMQQTQGLWDLGDNEKPILDYLAKHYAPENAGRRKQLEKVEWYILEE